MSEKANAAVERISEVITRVTRILSGRSIEVLQMGMKVGVEYDALGVPTKVFLPSLTENPSTELITAIQGFLDKEVSSLLYTQHEDRHRTVTSTPQFKKGMAKGLQEIIEDTRTERSMRSEFRGSAANFNANHDFAVKQILEPELAGLAGDPTKEKALLAMPAIRAACGELAYEEFMDGKWEKLGNLGGAILHYADELRDVHSTRDTFDLTRKIIKKFDELEENPPPPEPDEGEGDGDGEGGEGEGSGESDNSEGEDDDKSGTAASSKPEPGMGIRGGPVTEHAELDMAFDSDRFDKKMEDKIKSIATKEGKAAKYIPYTRQFDYVGPFPNIDKAISNWPSARVGQRIMDAAAKNSHVIQQQIQKLFMSKALVRWEPGLKRGKINSAQLSKLRVGDPRVFRKKIESDARNVAVSLVIDQSGSMACNKIEYACQAALMFSQVLTTLGIPHEISTFSTYTGYYGGSGLPHFDKVNKHIERRHEAAHDGVTYARFSPITNFIIKGFDQRLVEDTKKLICLIPEQYRNLMANNVDGECVDLAGRRLLRRKEKKKVMIVMSDGQPAADGHSYGALQQHLKDVVKGLSQAGVEMLGLGLLDVSVKNYYPKHQTVSRVEDIPTKILELTKLMVVGA